MRRKPIAPPPPKPFRRVTRGLMALVAVALGLLVLLGLGENPDLQSVRDVLGARRITIVLMAGHWQNDSGAVCPDGLQEVEITTDITQRTADLLRRQGFQVHMVHRNTPELDGLTAHAFLAIHADSCIDLTGFKIARMTGLADPGPADRLVETLTQAYAEATGLPFHANTITEDMRQYHALRRISADTPGAIIEVGFMGGDRHLLTEEPERVAKGIANGLTAFVRQRAAAPPVGD